MSRDDMRLDDFLLCWLLDSDPSIRWQALADLTDAPGDEVEAERAKVATEGVGARLLAMQAPDGRWGGAAWNRGWYLRRAGALPDDRVAEAIDLVASKREADGRWALETLYPGKMPVELDELGPPFGAGEGRPSRWITLRALRVLDWGSH